jgi:hypothetical protein
MGEAKEPKEPKKIKPTPKRKPAKTPVNKAIETAPENKAYGRRDDE